MNATSGAGVAERSQRRLPGLEARERNCIDAPIEVLIALR